MSVQYKFLSFYNKIRYFLKQNDIPYDAAGTHFLADTSKHKDIQDFQTIVGLIMSAQTKNHIIDKAMRNLKLSNQFDAFHISNMHEADISKLIEGVTFPVRKSKMIKETAIQILSEYNGKVPTDLKQLQKLKGIGKSSSELFQKKVQSYESKHINLSQKTLLFLMRVQILVGYELSTYSHEKQLKNPLIQQYLQSFIDPILWKTLHIPIDLFVDKICLIDKPKCNECPLRDSCPTFLQQQQINEQNQSSQK